MASLEDNANIQEYLLGLDDLQQPKIIDMSIISPNVWNSAVLLIARLLLLKKGTYPDHPDLGIDIRARYKFAFEDDLFTLQQEVESQIRKYLPELNYVQVKTSFQKINNQHCVYIGIIINKILYAIIYDIGKETIMGLEDMG